MEFVLRFLNFELQVARKFIGENEVPEFRVFEIFGKDVVEEVHLAESG